MRRTRMQWMTKLALAGTLALSVVVTTGRAQQATDVPPVPPPVGETTPIPRHSKPRRNNPRRNNPRRNNPQIGRAHV